MFEYFHSGNLRGRLGGQLEGLYIETELENFSFSVVNSVLENFYCDPKKAEKNGRLWTAILFAFDHLEDPGGFKLNIIASEPSRSSLTFKTFKCYRCLKNSKF